jgi:hypothetical protein
MGWRAQVGCAESGLLRCATTFNSDFLAAHALTHVLEHEQLVADAVDSLAAFLVVLDDQLASAGSHDAAHRDDLVEPERARLAADVAL